VNDELLALLEQVIRDVKDVSAAAKLAFRLSENHIRQRGGRPVGPAQANTPAATLPVPAPASTEQPPAASNLRLENNPAKPAETSALTVSGSDSGSGSFSLALSDRISKQSSLGDRRSNEPLPPGFGDFWALYPRRVGKADAIRAWVRQRPPAAEARTALVWQIEAWDSERPPRPTEKIPHPATWLNGRRWEDERPQRQARPAGFTEKELRGHQAADDWATGGKR
jgi:hypothetical protein